MPKSHEKSFKYTLLIPFGVGPQWPTYESLDNLQAQLVSYTAKRARNKRSEHPPVYR